MKKRSFIRNLSIMLFMQFVLLTALFVALIVHMRNSAVTEMETAADNVLAIYRVNLENRIERANNILKNLTLSEETALEMIRSDKESDRYYAKKSIYTAMHAALLQDNAVDLLIVAENSYGGYMESTNGDSSKWALPYETRKAVEATPGTEESKEPPKKQPIKEVLQDKADEKKAQRTAPAQTKHRQQDMEL